MEFLAPRLTKSRTQKRQKRLIKNRRRNQRRKLEVKSYKRRITTRDNNYAPSMKQHENYCTMTANAFWENYKVAYDWQHRHNVAWWKSRCFALEHENRILRDKIKEQAAVSMNNRNQTRNYYYSTFQNRYNILTEEQDGEEDELEEAVRYREDEQHVETDNENFEFHVDEEMMKFLEQSIRHKMELKRIRDSENDKFNNDNENGVRINSSDSTGMNRTGDMKSLYGEASSRILVIETSLQALIDQYRDRAKPHYWPNIPLRP